MANGSDAAMPLAPFGNQREPPGSLGATASAWSHEKWGSAPTQKTTSTASASNVIATVTRNVSSTPAMLMPTKSA